MKVFRLDTGADELQPLVSTPNLVLSFPSTVTFLTKELAKQILALS